MKLDKILNGFTKTIVELEKFCSDKITAAEVSEGVIANLKTKVEIDKSEADRATTIAEKLKAIIGSE